MKRFVVFMMALAIVVTSVSAATFTLSSGAALSSLEGTPVLGLYLDGTYFFSKNYGVKLGCDYTALEVEGKSDGLALTENTSIVVPVLLWAEFGTGPVSAGAGVGISTLFEEDIAVTLCGGLDLCYAFSRNFRGCLGVTGNLDCLPSLVSRTEGESTVLSLEASDFSRSSLVAKVGVAYTIGG